MKSPATFLLIAFFCLNCLAAQSENNTKEMSPSDLKKLERKALDGDAESQTRLGYLYEFGDGVEEDHAAAFKWYEMAVESGNAMAQFYLGNLYIEGKGVKKNNKTGRELLTKACDKKISLACYNMGYIYYNGIGIKRNPQKAADFLVRSLGKCDQVSCVPAADHMLGLMYSDGDGVKKDDRMAALHLYRAAEEGNTEAADKLILLAINGSNPAKAYAAYILALDKKDYDIAFKYAVDAAENNEYAAHYLLAWVMNGEDYSLEELDEASTHCALALRYYKQQKNVFSVITQKDIEELAEEIDANMKAQKEKNKI